MDKNFLDKTIEFLAPQTALKRYAARNKMEAADKLQQIGRRFDAASKSRQTDGWFTDNSSSNTQIGAALTMLRKRSRDLARNNPYAINTLRVIPNNVVGTGIMPTPVINGRTGKDEKIKKAWNAWADKLTADYDQRVNFYGMQWLALRTMMQDGEVFIIRVKSTSDYKIPLRLQMLSAEFLDTNAHDTDPKNGNTRLYGIEFNGKGERQGYWIFNKHPNEFNAQSRLVPAKDVIHLYLMEDAGQIRGVPLSKGTMLRSNDLDDYEFAERIRAKIATCFTAFVTDADTTGESSDTQDDLSNMEPGTVRRLAPGEGITFAQPPLTNGYAEYVRSNLRSIAAGNGLTYESLTSDYSNVNFSSGRMGWLEFHRNVQQLQWNILIPQLCDKVFAWFVEAAKLAGYIAPTADVDATWTAPRREMIDPLKETQAESLAVANGFKTLYEKLREDGYNPDEVMAELVQVEKFKKDNEIVLGADAYKLQTAPENTRDY